MFSLKKYRGLGILAWFIALFIFNVASHWSQNADKGGLYILLQALGQLTTPVALILSAAVVYGILSSGETEPTDSESRTWKKQLFSHNAFHTAYILGATVVMVIVIGLLVAWLPRGGTNQVVNRSAQSNSQAGETSANPHALDGYELMSKSQGELGTEEDGLSPQAKKRMREALALQLAGGFQKQNNPIHVDIAGDNHDVLLFQLPSMNDETANELIQEFAQGDGNFWNGVRLMNYSQIVFSGGGFKKIVTRQEFIGYGKDYDKYIAAFLKATKGIQAGAEGELTKRTPSVVLPSLTRLKEMEPEMSPYDLKRLRAATGASQIQAQIRDPDAFKLISASSLADGTVCYQYSASANGGKTVEYAVLTTEGQLYLDAFGRAPWHFCDGKTGEEMIETAK